MTEYFIGLEEEHLLGAILLAYFMDEKFGPFYAYFYFSLIYTVEQNFRLFEVVLAEGDKSSLANC